MREVADRGEGQVCGLGAEDGSSPSSDGIPAKLSWVCIFLVWPALHLTGVPAKSWCCKTEFCSHPCFRVRCKAECKALELDRYRLYFQIEV